MCVGCSSVVALASAVVLKEARVRYLLLQSPVYEVASHRVPLRAILSRGEPSRCFLFWFNVGCKYVSMSSCHILVGFPCFRDHASEK